MSKNKQQGHISELFRKLGPSEFNPLVEQHYEKDGELNYGKWKEYQAKDRVIDERSVLPNEVVIDIDKGDTTEERRKETKNVCRILELKDIPFFVAYSGGTGYHIHVIFEIPDNIGFDRIKYYRKSFFNYLKEICREQPVELDLEAWDQAPVEFDEVRNKGHLIRAVGGRHPETGLRKTIVSKNQLENPEITDIEEVNFDRGMTGGWVKINRISETGADLTWEKIEAKAKDLEEQEENQIKDIQVNNDVVGLDVSNPRNLPVHKVLNDCLEGYEGIEPGDQISCPIHDDNNPSSKITEGNHELPEGKLICFSGTCKEESNKESPAFKVWNPVEIIYKNGDFSTYQEADEFLRMKYDLDYQLIADKDRYLFENDDGNKAWDKKAIAEDIQKVYHFKATPVDGQQQIYAYEDDVWKVKGETIIRDSVRKLTEDSAKKQIEEDVIRRIARKNRIYPQEGDFEMPKLKVPFNNGVYDVEKEEFIDHEPDFNFRIKHKVNYIEDLEEEKTDPEKFLEELIDTDRKKQILMESIGLSLLPSFPIDTGLLMYGPGSNGKNQVYKMITKMTDNYHTIDLEDKTDDQFSGNETEDKTIVFFDEISHMKNPGKIKQYIGKDEERIRPFHGQGYLAPQRSFPLMATNQLPNPPEQTDGFFRRFELMEFPYKFTDNPGKNEKKKVSEEKLEEKYWKKEELDKFASKCINMVKEVIEKQDFTQASSTEATREKWNNQSSPVYTFIELFAEKGKKVDQGDNITESDFILKNNLLEMANIYMEATGNSKVRKQDITRALNNMAEFNDVTHKTKENEWGQEGKAYVGIKMSVPDVQDTPGVLPTSTLSKISQCTPALNFTASKWVKPLHRLHNGTQVNAISYLLSSSDSSSDLVELVRELELQSDDLEDITNLPFIYVVGAEGENLMTPVFQLDQDKLEEYYQQHNELGIENGVPRYLGNWLREKVSSWSVDTQVEVETLIEEGTRIGFSELEIEDRINLMIDQKKIKQGMNPGTVMRYKA